MTLLEEVEVEWNGPYKIDSVLKYFNEYEDFGIYMMTRKWGKFREKILYIGITYRQDFSTRLSQHSFWLDEVIGRVKVRLGYLQEKSSSFKRLCDVESFLLYVYEPKYNEVGTQTYHGRTLRIINSGRRGPLDRVVDSRDYFES